MASPRLPRPILASSCLCLALLLPACVSAPAAPEPAEAGSAERAELERLETELLRIELSLMDGTGNIPPTEKLRREQRETLRLVNEPLSALADRPWTDLPFRLECLSLAGESALLSGESLTARSRLAQADELSGYGSSWDANDPAPLLRSRLVPDRAKRLQILQTSVSPGLWGGSEASVPPRLLCELGLLYASMGMDAEAEAAFGKGLPRLRRELRVLYQALPLVRQD